MKNKWIHFDSYLDKQRTENLLLREHQQEAKRCGWIKLYDGTRLLRKSTQLMSSGLPQTTKSRKFTVERDKDCDQFCNFHMYTNVD